MIVSIHIYNLVSTHLLRGPWQELRSRKIFCFCTRFERSSLVERNANGGLKLEA